jgi:cytochrome P450
MPGFHSVIVKHLEKSLHEWEKLNDVTNIAPAISKLTYGIAGECFFGAEVEASAGLVYKSIEVTSSSAIRRMSSPIPLPLWVPLPHHLRTREAIRALNQVVFTIIEERKRHPSEKPDVLSRLIQMGFSDADIRDEVMTMLLAGHETTANAIAWTMWLLAQHPEIQLKLHDELKTIMSGELPTYEEIEKLEFTRMVFEESMRLYPPAGMLGRKCIHEDIVGGYEIKAGTRVLLTQWITHRHPDFWPAPNEFRPERFADPTVRESNAYFPFADGLRECVGKNMAMLEGIALVAGIMRRFRLEFVAKPEVHVRPMVTLRPDPGVFLKLKSWN